MASQEHGSSLELTKATYPQFTDEIKRRATFQTWPLEGVSADEMAESGMVYRGEDDRTICFYCGIALREWKRHDEPFIEHARFSPTCEYLLEKKGLFFVQAVLDFYDIKNDDFDIIWNERIVSKQTPSSLTVAENAEAQRMQTGSPSGPSATGASGSSATERRSVVRSVQPREIRARLDLNGAQTLLSYGFPKELIGQVIGEKLETSGDDFRTFGELAKAVGRAAHVLGIKRATERRRNTQPNLNRMTLQAAKNTGYDPPSGKSTSRSEARIPSGEVDKKEKRENVVLAASASPSSLEAMRNNTMLKKKVYCKRCQRKPADVLFRCCDHLVCCEECSKQVSVCLVCHKKAGRKMRVYIP